MTTPHPNDPLDFSARTVLVVGGSSGIGNGVAHGFKARGADVAVWGTRANASDYDGVEGSDLDGLAYQGVDAADPAAVTKAAGAFERLDALVLCQGTVLYKRQEFEAEGWQHVMSVNIDSVMVCANALKPALARAKGSLVTVSSVAGFNAVRGNPAYSASKSGLVGLTKTLGEAWAGDGIRVNGIAPGLVDTKLTKVTTQHPARLEASLRAIPVQRMGTPEDMAGAVLFLCSPLAAYVIGQTLIVDGGLTLS